MQGEGRSEAADAAPVGAEDVHDESTEIADYVRRNSRTVDVSALNDRGLKRIQLLTTSKLRELVSREVARCVERSRLTMDEVHSDEIEGEVHRELERRLEFCRREQEAARRLTPRKDLLASLGVEPADDESASTGAVPTDGGAPRRYAEKLLRMNEESRIYSREAFAELELRLQFIVLETLDKELRRKGYRGTVELEGFRQGLEQVVRDVLQSELDRRLLRLGEDPEKRVDLLERRLAKLKGELLEMEIAMDGMGPSGDPGLASIYQEVQSLNRQDPAYETKKGMLRTIFESNLELQGRVK